MEYKRDENLDCILINHYKSKERHKKHIRTDVLKDKRRKKICDYKSSFSAYPYYIKSERYIGKTALKTIPEHKVTFLEFKEIKIPIYDKERDATIYLTRIIERPIEKIIPEQTFKTYTGSYYEPCTPYIKRYGCSKKKKDTKKYTNRKIRNKRIDIDNEIGSSPANYRKMYGESYEYLFW